MMRVKAMTVLGSIQWDLRLIFPWSFAVPLVGTWQVRGTRKSNRSRRSCGEQKNGEIDLSESKLRARCLDFSSSRTRGIDQIKASPPMR